jgi:hypothetical protein
VVRERQQHNVDDGMDRVGTDMNNRNDQGEAEERKDGDDGEWEGDMDMDAVGTDEMVGNEHRFGEEVEEHADGMCHKLKDILLEVLVPLTWEEEEEEDESRLEVVVDSEKSAGRKG